MDLDEEQKRFLKLLIRDLKNRYGEDWRETLGGEYPIPDSFSDKFDLHLDVKFESADDIFQQLIEEEIVEVEVEDQKVDQSVYSVRYRQEGNESLRDAEFKGTVRGQRERKYLYISEEKLNKIEEKVL